MLFALLQLSHPYWPGTCHMSARDFINETLLPWLEEEIASEAQGGHHNFRGVEDTGRQARSGQPLATTSATISLTVNKRDPGSCQFRFFY
jgi:hypothetical protein